MAAISEKRPDLETLAMVVACSPIVVKDRCAQHRLPAGFEAVDIAILGWIAAEAQRISRRHSVH